MRRILFAVCMALMILSGCEYHPYYDGQEFCVYNAGCGLLETDGGHAIVPTVGRDPYVLEFYGGKGANQAVAAKTLFGNENPISKSGANHRIAKIMQLAEELKKERGKS